MPAVYAIAVSNVTDPDKLATYATAALPTLAEAELVALDTSVRASRSGTYLAAAVSPSRYVMAQA